MTKFYFSIQLFVLYCSVLCGAIDTYNQCRIFLTNGKLIQKIPINIHRFLEISLFESSTCIRILNVGCFGQELREQSSRCTSSSHRVVLLYLAHHIVTAQLVLQLIKNTFSSFQVTNFIFKKLLSSSPSIPSVEHQTNLLRPTKNFRAKPVLSQQLSRVWLIVQYV